MQFTGLIDDLFRALGFLSRLPLPGRFFAGHDGSMARAARAFPLAGLLIAAAPAAMLGMLLWIGADPLVATLLALVALTLLTGALHEDGLADTADGLGGGRDRAHALEIMKDSRIGTYAGVALILSFALRAAALAAIARHAPPLATAAALAAAAAVSRGLMVWHWSALPPARPTGVAAAAGQPYGSARTGALLSGAVIASLLLLPTVSLTALLTVLALPALAAFAFTRWIKTRLGGHTGDTIGATQQICEIALLCSLATAV
jgi:adenosylcobinamide-GDP ribazoletransferase